MRYKKAIYIHGRLCKKLYVTFTMPSEEDFRIVGHTRIVFPMENFSLRCSEGENESGLNNRLLIYKNDRSVAELWKSKRAFHNHDIMHEVTMFLIKYFNYCKFYITPKVAQIKIGIRWGTARSYSILLVFLTSQQCLHQYCNKWKIFQYASDCKINFIANQSRLGCLINSNFYNYCLFIKTPVEKL